jgi:hypothetical protein
MPQQNKGGCDVKSHVKKPYEAAEISLISYPSDDLMTGSPEEDEAFFGDIDSFISGVLKL